MSSSRLFQIRHHSLTNNSKGILDSLFSGTKRHKIIVQQSRRTFTQQLARTVDCNYNYYLSKLRGFSQCNIVNGNIRYNLLSSRTLSSAASTTASTSTGSSSQNTQSANKNKDDSNFFLDNIGKFFLAGIGAIILTLVRGSYNTSNRNDLRDKIEESSALDPIEIDDLRIANSQFTPDVFRQVVNDLRQQYPSGTLSYSEFTNCTRTTMAKLKGSAFTIELGHLLDRVVLSFMKERGHSYNDQLSISFWLALLSLALHGTVDDRIRLLYDAMRGSSGDREPQFQDVLDMVGYLQDTCQLVPDSQIVASETKYPTQQFLKGKPRDLVPWSGDDNEFIDIDAFAAILRSKSVCAWGECYHKKEFESLLESSTSSSSSST